MESENTGFRARVVGGWTEGEEAGHRSNANYMSLVVLHHRRNELFDGVEVR